MSTLPTVLVVGSGFAAFHFCRHLERRLPASKARVVVASPVDYLLYTSLLPQVAAGVLEPRHVAVGLRTLKRTELELGHVVSVDLAGQTVAVRRRSGETSTLAWDRLVLGPGAVTRTFDIPGVNEHAHGLKSLAEAVALRDHVLRQLEIADTASSAAERTARCTFVVVGAGYTGTELAAQLQALTEEAVSHYPRLADQRTRWVLLDLADRVLPELDPRLSTAAARVLADRGVDVRLGTSVKEATSDGVTLTDGSSVPCRTLVWTAGVTPSPLIKTLGLPTEHGRLVVDATFRVPDHPRVFAFGDAAAVPDLTRGPGALTGQTAQHAQRQGRVAARNVAASLGHGSTQAYRHRDLGFVVDLGGVSSVANPLHVPLSGVAAAAVTRGYHLAALPAAGNRVKVATDWLLDAVLPPQLVQLGFVPRRAWAVAAEPGLPDDGWRESAEQVPTQAVTVCDLAVPSSARGAG